MEETMHITRIHPQFLGLAALLGSMLPWQVQAGTPAYPERPVRVIVGLAPGGATDIQARLFAQKMTEVLGQQFIVDNRSGAGTLIGTQIALASSSDGYTLLAVTPSFSVVAATKEKPPFDPVGDFTPVSLLTKAPYVLAINPAVPIKTMKDFITYTRVKPGAINIGVSGIGTLQHLGVEWMQEATKAKYTIVPFKGTVPAMLALMSNEIQCIYANPVSSGGYIKSGKLRALAVTTPERAKILPDVPTIAESGAPGFDLNTWHGWLIPGKAQGPVLKRLNDAIVKIARMPDMEKNLEASGAIVIAGGSEQFRKVIAEDYARWTRIARSTGLVGK